MNHPMDSASKLADLQRARQSIIQDEQERVNAEQRHKDELAGIEAQIEALKADQTQQHVTRLSHQNSGLIAENQRAVNELHSALAPLLDTLKIMCADVEKSLNNVGQTFGAQQTNADSALALVNTAAIVASEHRSPTGKARPDEVMSALYDAERDFPTATPPNYALLQWVLSAENDRDRRLRMGLAYALSGVLFTNKPANIQQAVNLDAHVRRFGGGSLPVDRLPGH